MNLVPQLLVSIRDASEVAPAIEGGCDILDVKDPARGSLGRADVAAWQSIAEEVQRLPTQVPCSVALGEMTDDAPATPLPRDWQFAKLGTAGLESIDDWPGRIDDNLRRWRPFASPICRWVLVVYADWQPANSPSPIELRRRLPFLLADQSWDGVLIDTFTKSGGTLLDFIDAGQLSALGEVVRQAGKLWCIAGSLKAEALPEVLSAHPDVVGIRTAGCRNRRRDQPLDADAVRAFRDAMHAAAERFPLAMGDGTQNPLPVGEGGGAAAG